MSEFDKKFKDSVGLTPEHLRYKLEDIHQRLSSLEDKVSDVMPMVGVSMIKMEAMLSLLNTKGLLVQSETESEIDRIANSIGVERFLESKE